MLEEAAQRLKQARERKELRDALEQIMELKPYGPTFFKYFLKHCNVTKPRVTTDPYKSIWNEARRHLAMSYLNLMAADDPQRLINLLEEAHDGP